MTPEQYTQRNESCRLKAYQDTAGVWTCGWGCTGPDIIPGTVWTQAKADDEFAKRYQLATQKAALDLGVGAWACLDPVRRAALCDMAYQLGGVGLAKFKNMLSAVRAQSWQLAHDECLDSAYAHQTPGRAQRNARMLLTGCWPDKPF